MIINVMAMSEYCSFNIKLAKLLGINAAVYWQELMDICVQVQRKQTLDERGFFTLDRKYVEDRTALTVEEQVECDQIFNKLEAIYVDPTDSNIIGINAKRILDLILNDDPAELKVIADSIKISKTDKAKSKKNGIISTMQRIAVKNESNADVCTAYSDWVVSVYESKRFLTKVIIEQFKTDINSFAGTDDSAKLGLLREAIIHGYTDAKWVIDLYTKAKKGAAAAAKVTGSMAPVCTEIDSNMEF